MYNSASRETINRIVELRKLGKGFHEIGKMAGVSYSCAWDYAHGIKIRRTCAVPECGNIFYTTDPRKIYCKSACTKLGSFRKAVGIELVRQECSLPECTAMVWAIKGRKRFCSSNCCKRDFRRTRSGFYARLIGTGTKCAAPGCAETLVIEEHHYRLKHGRAVKRKMHAVKNKSDKSGPSIRLCANHHASVHRGFAKIVGGVYVDLTGLLRSKYTSKNSNLESSA